MTLKRRMFAAAVAMIGAAALTACTETRPQLGVCSRDSEIENGERQTIDAAAAAFVNALYAGDANAAFAAMSPSAQSGATREGIGAVIETVRAVPGQGRAVAERFLLLHAGAESGQSQCVAGDRVTTLANGGGAKAAFALVSEALPGGAQRTWTLWLTPHDGAWRVRAFNFGLSEIAGRNARDLIEEALRQERLGNTFNATILFDVANQISQRASFFVSAEQNLVRRLRSERSRHPDLAGEAPYAFALDDMAFPVSAVRPLAFESGDLALLLVQAPRPWQGEDAAEASNRALIDAMNAHRGEWSAVFDPLIVQTPMDQPERSWGTVYRRARGYVADGAAVETAP